MNLDQLIDQMHKLLNEKRFIHSQGVMEVSHDLALIHGYSTKNADVAGILHDCAKHLSDEELLKECERYHLPVSAIEYKSAYLLHAKVGAYYAQFKYGIEDKDILSAITYHTTGRPNMSLLEKIVFTADYIEPNRKPIPGLEEIRQTAYCNLDKAVFMITWNTLEYLESIGAVVDTLTNKTYEYYKNNKN